MAKGSAVVVEQAEAIQQDDFAAFASFATQGARIDVYRLVNGNRSWCCSFEPDAFDEAALAQQLGGGRYLCQLKDASRTIRKTITVEIDASIRPVRRPPPPSPLAGFMLPAEPQHVEQAPAWATQLMQRMDRIEQGAGGGGSAGLSTRDIIELVTRQPAQQQGLQLDQVIKAVEILKPKSSVEELFGAMRLMKGLSKNADAIPDAEPPDTLSTTLAALLPPLLSRFAGPPDMSPQPVRVPRPAPAQVQQAPQPAAIAPKPAATVSPMLQAFVPMLAKSLADQLTVDPTRTAADITDAIMANIPEDAIAEHLLPLEEGTLTQMCVAADPRLRPFAARLLKVEGLIEAEFTDDDDDSVEGEDEGDPLRPADDAPPVVNAAPESASTPEPAQVEPPATPVVPVASSKPARTAGRKVAAKKTAKKKTSKR